MDPPKHKAHRGMLMRLITPKRLKENEDFMWRRADRQIDEFVARGECEFIRDFAGPFTLYVIADLLGVPEADHETFREELQGGHRPPRGSAAPGRVARPLARSNSSTTGSPPTSRSAGARRATTSSPGWPRPRSPTAPRPR